MVPGQWTVEMKKGILPCICYISNKGILPLSELLIWFNMLLQGTATSPFFSFLNLGAL